MKLKAFIPAIIWLIISTVLLALPGNDLPHIRFFDFPNFDKLVHVGMFCLLSGLFSYPVAFSYPDLAYSRYKLILIAFYVLAYGVAMEFVQKYFIPGRSFDVFDMICDGVGSFAGIIAVAIIYNWYKKIGPDGNRGRNQN